jgi:regulator of protease activity HflC (stomatin/prohibitin superfamily)
MFEIIVIVILAVVAVGAILFSFKFRDSFPRTVWRGVGAGAIALALVIGFFSSFYTQSVGEAKVILNFDGTIAGQDLTPGSDLKAPWQSFSDWDLFAQEISYVAGGDTNYSGGKVTGPQITSAVANGAQVNLDLSVVYSIDPEKVTDLYKKYRTQEAFTKQVIENAIRSATRDVPSQYSAVDFRGADRGTAQGQIQDALQAKLKPFGVNIEVVNLQEIRYSDDVENSLKAVEVANQKEAEAQANLNATQISAQAQVVEAQAAADANRLLSESLTPQVLQQKLIDAYKDGTVFVVPEGATPFVQVQK